MITSKVMMIDNYNMYNKVVWLGVDVAIVVKSNEKDSCENVNLLAGQC